MATKLSKGDLEMLAKAWGPVVKQFVEHELAPLRERVAYLEGARNAIQNRSTAASGNPLIGEDGAE